jgi:hypothetical protein
MRLSGAGSNGSFDRAIDREIPVERVDGGVKNKVAVRACLQMTLDL